MYYIATGWRRRPRAPSRALLGANGSGVGRGGAPCPNFHFDKMTWVSEETFASGVRGSLFGPWVDLRRGTEGPGGPPPPGHAYGGRRKRRPRRQAPPLAHPSSYFFLVSGMFPWGDDCACELSRTLFRSRVQA